MEQRNHYARMGKRKEAQQVLKSLLTRSQQEYVSPVFVADLHFALEENDQGFEWLRAAYAQRDPHVVHLKVLPFYDSVRSDTRFTDILKKMRLDK